MKLQLIVSLFILSFSAIADVAKEVVIDKPFARAAIQQQRNSAAFMTLTNAGNTAAIVSAKSPVAKIVELHTHINDNGVMRMRKVKQIALPAQQKVYLKPGGLHVMLLGLNRDLNPGELIELTLNFDDGSEKLLSIPVQKMMMRMKKDMKGHKMDGSLPKMMKH